LNVFNDDYAPQHPPPKFELSTWFHCTQERADDFGALIDQEDDDQQDVGSMVSCDI